MPQERKEYSIAEAAREKKRHAPILEALQKRLVVGEETLLYNLIVQEQKAQVRTSIEWDYEKGSMTGKKIKVPNIDAHGLRNLDQVHQYYLAVITGPKVQFTFLKGYPQFHFESNGYARHQSSYEEGQSVGHFSASLRVPSTTEILAVGRQEIDNWKRNSALYEHKYKELKATLQCRISSAALSAI